jgi:predicted phosphate transport protein (TIGR00153 family)
MFAEMSANLQEGARVLAEVLRTGEAVVVKVQRIKELEHRGDDMTHAVITKLNQTFITPFDREDIHKLASSLDDVLDYINAAGDRLILYEITNIPPPAADLADIVVRQCEQLTQGVKKLEKHDNVLDYCVEINRLENEADHVVRTAIAQLFKTEKDPIALIKIKELYEVLEMATDKAEDAANVLESVVVKSA